MKSYHRFMLTTALALSAGAFRLASRLLDSAIHHKGKLKDTSGYWHWDMPSSDTTGYMTEDIDINEVEAPRFYKTTIHTPNQWIDAEPDDFKTYEDYREK